MNIAALLNIRHALLNGDSNEWSVLNVPIRMNSGFRRVIISVFSLICDNNLGVLYFPVIMECTKSIAAFALRRASVDKLNFMQRSS